MPISKPFRDMTDNELREEWKMWDEKVRNASGWGAAVAVANSFRKNCERELEHRGLPLIKDEK
jgi:hypothetical protein